MSDPGRLSYFFIMLVLSIVLMFSGLSHAQSEPSKEETRAFISQMMNKHSKCEWTEDGDSVNNFEVSFSLIGNKAIFKSKESVLSTNGRETTEIEVQFSSIDLQKVGSKSFDSPQPCFSADVYFECKDYNSCMQINHKRRGYSMGDLNRERDHSQEYHFHFFSVSTLEAANKLTKAFLHLWKLQGLDVEDATEKVLDEDMFGSAEPTGAASNTERRVQ